MLPDHEDPTYTQTQNLFNNLPQQEQIWALYEMTQYTRNDIAIIKRDMIVIRNNFEYTKHHDTTTSEKIRAILNKRFDTWSWFRDRILPYIIVAILFAVFQLTWGAKP